MFDSDRKKNDLVNRDVKSAYSVYLYTGRNNKKECYVYSFHWCHLPATISNFTMDTNVPFISPDYAYFK